jgi:hypothetical protein
MTQLNNPYQNLPPSSFWRTGVLEHGENIDPQIYKKKFEINITDKVATAGSCFAQHIGSRLKSAGFNVLDYESPPWFFPGALNTKFGNCLYSARYGNIYTVKQLLQLVKEAFGISQPSNFIWKMDNGRFIDALRPKIEPEGFSCPDEVIFHRQYHLEKVRGLFLDMDLLIFTFGLTEAWIDKVSGTVFPMAPGVIAEASCNENFEYINFNYKSIYEDTLEVIDILDSLHIKKKYLFTVSPVPLTATASNNHVMVATTHSKSVLRAAVGEVSHKHPCIDYFPSYEIITNPWSSINKFEANKRSVLGSAVDEVMKIFFSQHSISHEIIKDNLIHKHRVSEYKINDVICEEELLDSIRRSII